MRWSAAWGRGVVALIRLHERRTGGGRPQERKGERRLAVGAADRRR